MLVLESKVKVTERGALGVPTAVWGNDTTEFE
jgi:hypothetical protein